MGGDESFLTRFIMLMGRLEFTLIKEWLKIMKHLRIMLLAICWSADGDHKLNINFIYQAVIKTSIYVTSPRHWLDMHPPDSLCESCDFWLITPCFYGNHGQDQNNSQTDRSPVNPPSELRAWLCCLESENRHTLTLSDNHTLMRSGVKNSTHT